MNITYFYLLNNRFRKKINYLILSVFTNSIEYLKKEGILLLSIFYFYREKRTEKT